jgi:hypothetical protein
VSHRPVQTVSPEHAGRNASAAIALAQLLPVEADRPKRIDQYLDYFGESSLSARLASRVGLHDAPP